METFNIIMGSIITIIVIALVLTFLSFARGEKSRKPVEEDKPPMKLADIEIKSKTYNPMDNKNRYSSTNLKPKPTKVEEHELPNIVNEEPTEKQEKVQEEDNKDEIKEEKVEKDNRLTNLSEDTTLNDEDLGWMNK